MKIKKAYLFGKPLKWVPLGRYMFGIPHNHSCLPCR